VGLRHGELPFALSAVGNGGSIIIRAVIGANPLAAAFGGKAL
jgi:hypothetical protein